MVHKYTERQRAGFVLFVVALILGASVRISLAQDNGLNLIQTAEYDIGLDCPVTAALDAAGTTLWILMDNCFGYHNSLHAYNVADGTQVDVDDYADALAGLDEPYVDLFITPMGFTQRVT